MIFGILIIRTAQSYLFQKAGMELIIKNIS